MGQAERRSRDLWQPDVSIRAFDTSTVTPDPADACPALHIMHGTCGTTEDGKPLWPAHNYTHPVTAAQLDRCRFCGCTRHQDAA